MQARADSRAEIAALPDIAPTLLAWYDRHARTLPWRVPPADRQRGVQPDPYHVWLSEVMLQQTQVATVRDYYRDFTTRWPTVERLAAEDDDAILRAWAGLGYYRRARNLIACARKVADGHDGKFPRTAEGLKALPGIGEYTAAAIAAIAFDEAEAVVDGNVERVVARLATIDAVPANAKPVFRTLVAGATPRARPGDFAQAMMDLGATICTPKRPACALCPLTVCCAARATGEQETFPRKAPRKIKPERIGAAFVLQRRDGSVLLHRRSEHGLLGGMTGLPSTAWSASTDGKTDAEAAPMRAPWRRKGIVRHTFTHFHLSLTVWHAQRDSPEIPPGHWWSQSPEDEALPTVMRKVLAMAIGETAGGHEAMEGTP